MNTTRATLKDVAEYSGFGLRTVIKAMNGAPSVREKNRKAILQAAQELHYVPNRAASALGKKKSIRLAVVYAKTSELYYPEVENGLRQAINDYCDYGLSLEYHVTTSSKRCDLDRLLESLVDRSDLDGVVLHPVSATKQNEIINKLVESGKPVVLFGADAPCSKRMSYVSCDAYKAGRICGQLLERIIPTGGTAFIINSSMEMMQILARTKGCMDRLTEKRPDVHLRTYWNNIAEEDYEKFREILKKETVNAIFCDDAKTVVIARILKELNRRDITLIGFDRPAETENYMQEGFVYVTVDQRPETFSYLAVKTLFSYLAYGTIPDPIQYTPVYLLTGECL